MLEEKLSDLKYFVGNIKLKTVAYVLAAGASLLPIYGCGDEEGGCITDSDCKEGSACTTICRPTGKEGDGPESCSSRCGRYVPDTTFVPD